MFERGVRTALPAASRTKSAAPSTQPIPCEPRGTPSLGTALPSGRSRAVRVMMSVSLFHRHFCAVTSMTPIQFQKQIRLHEARARSSPSQGDVTGVGSAVGYDSPSQFGREYRRMFGLPPSRDALALREAAALPSILGARPAA